MFKNKTLPWKTPEPNFIAFFVLIGMTFSFISDAQTFRKPGRHVVHFVCSQEYPRRTNLIARKTLFTGLVYANSPGIYSTEPRSSEVDIFH